MVRQSERFVDSKYTVLSGLVGSSKVIPVNVSPLNVGASKSNACIPDAISIDIDA